MFSTLQRRYSSLVGRIIARRSRKEDLPKVLSVMKDGGALLFDRHEIPFMFEVDPSFLYVAEKDGKDIVGFIAAMTYGERFTSFGLLVVKKEHRKSGVARLLVSETANLRKGRNTLRYEFEIDMNHHKNGTLFDALLECEYLEAVGRTPTDGQLLTGKARQSKDQFSVVSPSSLNIDDILTYDTGIHIEAREPYIRTMLKWPSYKTRVALDSNGKIMGYGTLRHLHNDGYHLAPLYSNNIHVAKLLFGDLLGFCTAGKKIYVLAPSSNKDVLELLNHFSMDIVSKGYRMSTYPTGIPLTRVYFPASVDCTLV